MFFVDSVLLLTEKVERPTRIAIVNQINISLFYIVCCINSTAETGATADRDQVEKLQRNHNTSTKSILF